MNKPSAERDLDCTNCARGVWLVKVPKYIREGWTACQPNTPVGVLKVVKIPNKLPAVSFTLSENSNKPDTVSKLPRNHKFILRRRGTLLGVFSQNSAATPEAEENEKVYMEGHVTQKFECQPVGDDSYFKLKRESVQKAATPVRKAVMISQPANVYKPKAYHSYIKVQEDKKKAEGKKARADRDKVQEMLFAAFEKHQYYNIKDLQKITKQPITYLKEILNEMCDYNMKNPHKNMWELKPEYRHYKEKRSEEAKPMETD